jgi:hypothetical protein
MSSSESDELARIRQTLKSAALSGDPPMLDDALDEAMTGVHNQVVQAHIGIVRRLCGGDAELGVRIANALCDAGAGRLQRWVLFAEHWRDPT